MRKDGKSFAISARKAGRQRLRQVTRWDTPDIDTAGDYVRQNPGTLYRNRYRVPSQKLEKIELLGRLKTAEIRGSVFKGVGLDSYPVIASKNPDLKAFCQSMRNKLNAADCAKFINEKDPATWEMIDPVDYLKDEELLILVQSINIQNQELFIRKDKFVFSVLQQACLQNYDFTLRVQDMNYEEGAVMIMWNIITEYIHDDEVLYLKEVSDKWMNLSLRQNESLRNFFSRVDSVCAEYLSKCHIKKLDAEILALVMKELPLELKYHLSILEGAGDGMRSWHWIKTKIVYFIEKFPQFLKQHQYTPRYPSRHFVANGAEAVNLICYYCQEQGHSRTDCPIRRVDLEDKGLNMDQVNEEDRQRRNAKKFGGDGMRMGGTIWWKSARIIPRQERLWKWWGTGT